MMGRSSRVPLNDSARLMQNVAEGDFEAFEYLYDRFAPILMHLFVRRGANLTLADDLTQEVFICLWQRRKDFREVSAFEAYLFSIAKYALSKEIRESRNLMKGCLQSFGVI
jgi:RNA polymerase sigma-70 factor (ECF subfamily)